MRSTSDGAVLFANLNANPVYEQLEESKAFQLVNNALGALRSAVSAHGGRVVKTIGDELLALFPDGPQAAMAAIDMHRGFAPQALAWPHGSRLTIGFAWGAVITDEGDVFGDVVGIAANANNGPARKKPGTIVIDGAALQRLPAPLSGTCRLIHSLKVRNGSVIQFYELPWIR